MGKNVKGNAKHLMVLIAPKTFVSTIKMDVLKSKSLSLAKLIVSARFKPL